MDDKGKPGSTVSETMRICFCPERMHRCGRYQTGLGELANTVKREKTADEQMY